MNRSLLVLGITLSAALPARADLTHKIQSSVQLEVGGASTRAIRVGNSYSISGSGVSTTAALLLVSLAVWVLTLRALVR